MRHPESGQVAANPAAAGGALIEHVIAHRQLRTVFQPLYSTASQHIIAVEALTRFDAHPIQPPDRWFSSAHQAGLGVELERAAIEVALEAASTLPNTIDLAVNVSPTALADAGLFDLLAAHSDLNLIVEITEHDPIDDYTHLVAVLRRLRHRGICIAVDDAGAGFASFRHIVAIKPDLIKVDRALTQGIENDASCRALATAFATFAQETDALLVAEGVETLQQLRAWTDLGAHAVQGYFLARPASLNHILQQGALHAGAG